MSVLLIQGDARRLPLADSSVDTCVTSPPYWALRSYGIGTEYGEIGLEPLHDCNGAFTGNACGACWVCAMRAVFKEVWRVMTPGATLWINVGDSMARSGAAPPRRDHSQGHGLGTYGQQGYSAACAMPARAPGPLPEKNLLGLPWRLALALQVDGFILRSAITWCKTAPMPESVTDRPTRATEMLFLFAKQAQYYYDATAVRVTGGHGWRGSSFTSAHDIATKPGLGQQARQEAHGRNLWDYWVLGPEPLHMSHYAAFPPELVRRCLLAGCPRQVCSACGKPHVRQVERQRMLDGYLPVTGTFAKPDEPFRIPPNGKGHYRYTTQTTDHGFVATCPCTAPTRPGLVLDPFCGSGTTLLVARELGLNAVGVDLSWAYLRDIARERLGLAALHRWTNGATPPPVRYSDLPLFTTEAL